VAIVGSRSYTAYGRDTARKLSADLAQAGLTIVSGLASGIDTHAHRGALDIKGLTIAVLGSALDCPYPPENGGLLQEILQNGLVVSEFPMGTGPEAHHFPRRNRIISGLSLATVVVEAGTRSGALLTAQHALEQNREVFAVPGPINSGKSTGTNQLIRNGAILVRNVEDILCEIAPQMPCATSPLPVPELDAEEQRIYDVLSSEGCHIDVIATNIQASAAQTLEFLLQLELKNIVEQMPGMRYRRK
jgi:DNA processing protein